MKLGRTGERPLWVLHISNVVRTAHQIGAAIFLCAFLFNDKLTLQPMFVYLAGLTGFVLFMTEGMRHRQIFRELTGVVTFVKLMLIGLAFHGMVRGDLVILLVFVLASLSSHAPKNIRHRLLF